MRKTARERGIDGTGAILRADQQGARVLRTSRGRTRKDSSSHHDDQYYWPPARSSEGMAVNE